MCLTILASGGHCCSLQHIALQMLGPTCTKKQTLVSWMWEDLNSLAHYAVHLLGPNGTMTENLRLGSQLVMGHLHSLRHTSLLLQVPTGTNGMVAELTVGCNPSHIVVRWQEPTGIPCEHSGTSLCAAGGIHLHQDAAH